MTKPEKDTAQETDDKYDAAMAEDARREAMPPNLRETKDILKGLLQDLIDNDGECACTEVPETGQLVACYQCQAEVAISKLTDDFLERDEKRTEALEKVAHDAIQADATLWFASHARTPIACAGFIEEYKQAWSKLSESLEILKALTQASKIE